MTSGFKLRSAKISNDDGTSAGAQIDYNYTGIVIYRAKLRKSRSTHSDINLFLHFLTGAVKCEND